jgi:transcriptional regulator with XRE-family HTH domain
MNIGDRIKQRRLALGMDADALAQKIGKSRATIYRYENGDIENMPTTVLEPIANALNTTPAYLMGWEETSDGTIQISKELLYTINKFSLVTDKNTGYSLMDIFKTIVMNKKFEEILKSILLFVIRTNSDWEKMVIAFNANENFDLLNIDTMQSLCRTNIIKKFEELLTELLNSDIEAFYSATIDNDENIHIIKRRKNDYPYGLNISSDTKNIEAFKDDLDISYSYFKDPETAKNYLRSQRLLAGFQTNGGVSDSDIIKIANKIYSQSEGDLDGDK